LRCAVRTEWCSAPITIPPGPIRTDLITLSILVERLVFSRVWDAPLRACRAAVCFGKLDAAPAARELAQEGGPEREVQWN
jgi:hypothetical protein